MSGTADLILELTNARLLCTLNECSTWEGSGGKSYLRMPMLLYCILIASQQQLMDTMYPPPSPV